MNVILSCSRHGHVGVKGNSILTSVGQLHPPVVFISGKRSSSSKSVTVLDIMAKSKLPTPLPNIVPRPSSP